jgi:diguanylate cyclase (GGDEF)-like protein
MTVSADKASVSALNLDTKEFTPRAAPEAPVGDDVVSIDPLVEESRSRPSSTLSRREWLVSAASAIGFVSAAVAMVLLFGAGFSSLSSGTAVFFIACYAAVSRIEFEIGTGSAVPTELVMVPMLFALPPAVVPLAVAIAYLAAAIVDVATGQLRARRLPVVLSTCWYVLGPALVLAAWGTRTPRWDDLPVYAAALLAQFGFDLGSSIVREWAGFGVSPASVMRFLRSVFLVDALLAPVGLTAAFVVATEPAALLGVLPLAVLLWLFARDRHARIDQALALSHAYVGESNRARHDSLTGLLNRLGWDEAFQAQQQHAAASGEATSLIVVDVDGLKAANDRHGHEFGDAVIRAIARVLTSSVRTDDVVARLGGDEFAVLLPASNERECDRIVRRLHELIQRKRVGSIALSASIGSATCRGSDDLAEALRRADDRMYQAKTSAPPQPAPEVDRRRH